MSSKTGLKKLICLSMIVKNESKNMVRLLDSLSGIIDMACITDTGSDDDTIDVISKWFEASKIPLTILEEPFKNFGYNRTKNIKASKNAYPTADFFLLSDADFIWHDHGFDSRLMIDHKYYIVQESDSLMYKNIRLISNLFDWECVGVTHEYWDVVDPSSEVRSHTIKTLRIEDVEDGGCKTDKAERDVRLLNDGLKCKKTSPYLRSRYEFYLANSLQVAGKSLEAIEHYLKREEYGGYTQEIFYSIMQIGACYEKLMRQSQGDERDEYLAKAISNYERAHTYMTSRSESLALLCTMYRSLGMHEDALNVAERGSKVPYPGEDVLFLDKACYKYHFDNEIAICAYYVPHRKKEGIDATIRLFGRNGIPEHIMRLIEANSRFYL